MALRQTVRERVRAGSHFIKFGLSKGGVHDRYHAWAMMQVPTFALDEISRYHHYGRRSDN